MCWFDVAGDRQHPNVAVELHDKRREFITLLGGAGAAGT